MAGLKNPTRTKRERTGGLVRPGLTAHQMPAVELDPRTAYDFLMSACNDCGEAEDLLPEDRAWLAQGRLAIIEEIGGAGETRACVNFATEVGRLLVDRPDVRTARELVEFVDGLDNSALTEALIGELLENPDVGDLAQKALEGNSAAYAALSDQLRQWKGREVMPDRLDEIAPKVRAVLHAWLPQFEPVEAKVERILQCDVSLRSKAEASRDPMGFIEKATNGIRIVPDSRTHRIMLAPSYFGRPYNSVTRVGDTTLVCYPIADSALGAAARTVPPAATVRLYRALGDETRLQILRLLSGRDFYLTELATELELSKPTISHHLAHLRSAGLVTVTEQGNLTYYSIRTDRAADAGPELRAFLSH